MLNIIFSILLIIIITIILIDVLPQLYTWQSRIHIGRCKNQNEWKNAILKVSKRWLKNTPTTKLTDNNRFILIDILKGNYKRNAIQHWQEAALLLGLTQTYAKTKNEIIKLQIERYINSKIDAGGKWKNKPKEVDSGILAYALLKANTIVELNIEPALKNTWKLIKNNIGEDGTLYYRKRKKDYRFVDTIGFISPFLISYGVKFNNQEAIDLGVKQITEFNRYALLDKTYIPCHTYHIKTKLPIGLFGWGRGLGWYAVGLIDSWNELANDSKEKEILTKNVIAYAKMIMQFQNDNGSWNWQVMENNARADSSATATLAWYLANASKIDKIAAECKIASEKALQYLMKVTRRDGVIDFSQGDTKGIGVYSQNFDVLPFTQGFALRTLFYNI